MEICPVILLVHLQLPGVYKIPYIQGGGDTLIMPFYVYITSFNQIVRLCTLDLPSCDSINVI
jgi:hypothetical protein